jgi:hypothetical protein
MGKYGFTCECRKNPYYHNKTVNIHTLRKIMTGKIISIEEEDGPFQVIFQRILRMVPDRDKQDKNLQRLIAFRLKIDGEAETSEYLVRKIREIIRCAYTGSLYDFLKDDLEEKICKTGRSDGSAPP